MADPDSPQNLYAKKLRQTYGYPLWYPEPGSGLPDSYAESGLQIGDVGYVDEDGMFMVQFNICSTLDHDLHQTKRKDLVGLVDLAAFNPNQALPVLNAFSAGRIICHGIRRSPCEAGTDNMKHEKFMTCSTSGAILILPNGALRQKLDERKQEEFRKLAEKYALKWCQSTKCTSLYLITGFYKTSSWHLASFEARPAGQVLLERDIGRYTWDPTYDYRQSLGENQNQNQTVLVSGFKIQVKEWPGDSHVWIEKLPLNSNFWSSLSFYASILAHVLKCMVLTLWDHVASQDTDTGRAHVNCVPVALSQPFHPSDTINGYLLRKNKNSKVAITHDSEWLNMLEENEISYEDMVEGERFSAFLEERYTDDPNSTDVVYLQRKMTVPSFTESGDENASSSDLRTRKLAPSPKTFLHPPVCNNLDVRWFVTHMRLENPVTCLKRMPVGFYVLLQFNGTRRWSKCKLASLSYARPLDSIVDWDDEIILPRDPEAEVEFSVYASFEFEPILGDGEMLCTVKRSVGSLARLGNMYFPWHAKNTSSDASLLVTLEERQFDSFLCCWTHHSVNSGDEDRSFAEVAGATDKGHSALLHFHDGQGTEELEKCVEYYDLALKCCPLDRDYYVVTLCNFATAKFISSQVHGAASDLDTAIASCYKALSLCSRTHPDQPRISLLLAQALLYCEMKVQRKASVTDEIKRLAIDVQHVCSGSSYSYQATLILQTLRRYQISVFDSFAKPTELDEFISELEWSAQTRPWCLDRPYRLVNWSIVLRRQFEVTGHLGHLEKSISAMNEAIEHIPDGHYDEPWIRASLGDALLVRFLRCGVVSDLDIAISMFEDALKAIPDRCFDRPWMLASLGNALRIRFVRSSTIANLESAIFMIEDAAKAVPDGHFDKSQMLATLGVAISMTKDAINVVPDSCFDKPWICASLGDTLRDRFARYGLAHDLDDAILMLEDSVEQISNGYLDDGIMKLWGAVDLTNHYPDKLSCLRNLDSALQTRFERLGELSDLEDGITRLRDAVELTPSHHPDKPNHLSNLGGALQTRFEHLGELGDLKDAIMRLQDAVKLTADHHPDKPNRLNNLGNALRTRFENLGEFSDLEDGITRLRDAVESTPDHHLVKPSRLSNLGGALWTRFKHLGELSDLEDGITNLRDAVESTPDHHPIKPSRLSNLGSVLQIRFRRLGEVGDIEDAISRIRDAVKLTPNQHSDLEEAISQYSSSALASASSVAIRLRACRHWAICACVLGHHSLLDAYAAAISILPQLAWAGLSLTDHYQEFTECADIVREAAAVALDFDLPETAVEWLEQGRSIIWGNIYQLRNSYDELLDAHPDYAHRLRQLSAALEHAGVVREKSTSLLSETMQCTGDSGSNSLQKQAERHRDLAIERDKLLQKICKLPGFERFLLQKEFSRLRASAHTGPVVILNAAEKRYDALIILAELEKPIHVPLSKFDPRRPTVRKDRDWVVMLSNLWNSVVKPVLDALAFSTPGDLSRIFWCPTGPFTFFPIHAAGLYGIQYSEPGHKVSDFVVSSYIPTLSILAPSRKSDTTALDNIRLLVVPQPGSNGYAPLPGVALELQYIKTLIESCPSGRITLTESSAGTVDEVLSLMKDSDWVHFACHGSIDYANPSDSGLVLADGRRFTASDIVALSRPRGGFAFLSASETAMGNQSLSHEAIHIAASILFAGYEGVVGSMWSISDRFAPVVARDVYEQLCQDGAIPDHRNAARALHNAVLRLYESGQSFSDWIPFIHVGL